VFQQTDTETCLRHTNTSILEISLDCSINTSDESSSRPIFRILSRVRVTRDGFGLVIGITELYRTKLQITTARNKSFKSIFISRCLVTACNAIASVFTSLLAGERFPTN
jgi:hypothetical protein